MGSDYQFMRFFWPGFSVQLESNFFKISLQSVHCFSECCELDKELTSE